MLVLDLGGDFNLSVQNSQVLLIPTTPPPPPRLNLIFVIHHITHRNSPVATQQQRGESFVFCRNHRTRIRRQYL